VIPFKQWWDDLTKPIEERLPDEEKLAKLRKMHAEGKMRRA